MAKKSGQISPPFVLFMMRATDKKPCDFSSLVDLEHFFFRTEIKKYLHR